MRMYIEVNVDEIIDHPLTEKNVKKVFGTLDPVELAEYNIYEIDTSVPELEIGQTATEDGFTLVNGKPTIKWIIVGDLDTAKAVKREMITELFRAAIVRPKVTTGVKDADGKPIAVDGSMADLKNFEIAKKKGFKFVVDANSNSHDITDADWDTIITAVEDRGVELYGEKFKLSAKVNACKTLTELEELSFDGAFGAEKAPAVEQ